MKVIPFLLLLLIVCFSTGCNNNNEVNTNSNLNKNETINNKENVNTMKVLINDKSYEVELFDSVTKNEIINMLPFELTLQRYAENMNIIPNYQQNQQWMRIRHQIYLQEIFIIGMVGMHL